MSYPILAGIPVSSLSPSGAARATVGTTTSSPTSSSRTVDRWNRLGRPGSILSPCSVLISRSDSSANGRASILFPLHPLLLDNNLLWIGRDCVRSSKMPSHQIASRSLIISGVERPSASPRCAMTPILAPPIKNPSPAISPTLSRYDGF